MNLRLVRLRWVIVSLIVSGISLYISPACARPWQPLTIEGLTERSDLVVKATALSAVPVEDASFTPMGGFAVYQTRFKVVSVLKGEAPGEIDFRHYRGIPAATPALAWREFYNFTPGRTYLLWAQRSPEGALRQHFMMDFSGSIALLTRDAAPAIGTNIRVIAWNELNFLLESDLASDVIYAIEQINVHSKGATGRSDFDRTSALNAFIPFFKSADDVIALTAIVDAGGSGTMAVQAELISVADDHTRPGSVRAAALNALRGVNTPEARQCAFENAQVSGGAPVEALKVTAAALGLLADYPGPETRKTWREAIATPGLRIAVADAAGKAADGEMAATLDALLNAPEVPVRAAAAYALLKMPPMYAHGFWIKRKRDPAFGISFTNVLFKLDPSRYRRAMAEALSDKKLILSAQSLPNQRQHPGSEAWQSLFDDLRALPRTAQLSDDASPLWDALEQFVGLTDPDSARLQVLYEDLGLHQRVERLKRQTHERMQRRFLSDENMWILR